MKYTYLALGDSYTIGEQVPLTDSFPYKTATLLQQVAVVAKNQLQAFVEPKIIARTGWTTDELNTALLSENITEKFDVVSLLIGVNNQYRGRSVENFESEFENLLQSAIKYADNKPNHVFVLSIPDWGVTAFAEGKNTIQIASEIDDYNKSCKKITIQYHCNFIDITQSQRIDGNKAAYLAADGLHPSGKEYAKWAEQLTKGILLKDKGVLNKG